LRGEVKEGIQRFWEATHPVTQQEKNRVQFALWRVIQGVKLCHLYREGTSQARWLI